MLRRVLALAGAVILTLSMSTFAFAADDIILDGDESGASTFVKDFAAKGGIYKYLGFVTTKNATSEYKYLQLTYKGDISCLRIEFNREDDSNEGPYWFNKDGQTLFFKTVDGSDIPLTPDKETTITIDLAATGIKDISEFRGLHLHYLDPNMQDGKFSIKNAKLMTSAPGTKTNSDSNAAKSDSSVSNTNSNSNANDSNAAASGDSKSSVSSGSNSSSASSSKSSTASAASKGTQGTAGGSTDAPSTGSPVWPIAVACGGIAVAIAAFAGSKKLKEE